MPPQATSTIVMAARHPRSVAWLVRSYTAKLTSPKSAPYAAVGLKSLAPPHTTSAPEHLSTMTVFTDYLWFNTSKRQEFIRITDEVAAVVKRSGVTEGFALVSAMHITAGVYVNDWENGLIHDFQVWLEQLAPAGLDYRHHQTGEDNADAHLKRTLMGHQVMLPITRGALDLGPWEQVFYAEFDGQRRKRVIVKVMGEK
jgi:secondary thiamine-phosphate synthase enzyme